ncbi:tetratricopeptide repeat protein [Streptomyces sp. NPDC020719]|uniref:tetratricopeptide repeat protein n=1 Tax=Streptomyces sp. NPDC020719 TaxID=3154896 RepID=UPI0033D2AAC5
METEQEWPPSTRTLTLPPPPRPTPLEPAGPPPGRAARRTMIGAAVAALLTAGVLVVLPRLAADRVDAPPPAPGPAARALTAVGAGAPAAAADLTALIADRRAWVRTHPADDASWAVLGSAYLARGLRGADSSYYPRAEWALRRSLAVRTAARGNLEAQTGLAALANARHDYAAARTLGEAVRRQQPKRWTVYPVLIEAYAGVGDLKAASKSVEQLLDLRGGSVALAQAGAVYRERGWREDAAASLTEAAAYASTPVQKADCLRQLGDLAWDRGEPAQALAQYEAALRTDPGAHAALAGKARAELALGRATAARHDYATAVARLPRPEYLLELGELYETQGLGADARATYERLRVRAAADDGHGVSDTLVLARFETDHGSPEAAVERLRAEWKRAPSAAVADALGWALYRAGDTEEALGYAKKAAEKGARTAASSYHRGLIERDLGQAGPARRDLDEALRTNPYFSPLAAAKAREALDALGDPPDGGPKDMYGSTPETPPRTGSSEPSGPGNTGTGAGTGTGSGSGTSSNSGSGAQKPTGSGPGKPPRRKP